MALASPVRRRRCGKEMQAPTTEDMPVLEAASARDLSELPLDALASVFSKLGAIEILMGAGLVCRSWLQAAKLPDLWRSVKMARHETVDGEIWAVVDPKINAEVLRAMAKAAVDRSCGQLQAFLGKRFVTDELLEYIAERLPALTAVGLISCDGVSNKGFTQLISKCPMIDDVRLVLCHKVGSREVLEATGKACPQLKRFRLKRVAWDQNSITAREALGVAAMHQLRSLALLNSTVITNDELASILDGCPHLENLDLRGCHYIVVDDELRRRCAGIKSLMLPRFLEFYSDVFAMYEVVPVSSRDCDLCGDFD